MRFSTVFFLPLLALASAAPNAVPNPAANPAPGFTDISIRGDASLQTTQQFTEILTYASQQASCNILKCIDLIGAGICVAEKLSAGDVKGLLECVSGGAKSVCPCAGCISALDKFLVNNHVC